MTNGVLAAGRAYARGPYWIAFGVTLLLLAASTLPPFVGDGARHVLMAGFSGVCHQLPDRSFSVHQVPLAVCHRCTGIYAGLWLSVAVCALARPHRAPGRAPLLVGLLIPGIDWLGDVVGLWSNTAVSRVLTGAVFGLIAGYYLAVSLSGDARAALPAERSPASSKAPLR